MPSNNTKKTFSVFSAGMSTDKNGNQIPYAFHMEGNVASEPRFTAADGDKKARLNFSVGVGRNPWLMLGDAEAKAQENNPNVNGDRPFVSITVFGDLAEKMNGNLTKGSRVVFCGRPSKYSYKRNDGTEVEAVQVTVDNIYPMSCRVTAGGDPAKTVTKANNCFVRRDGTAGSQQLVTLLAGVVSGADALRNYNGSDVIDFTLNLPMSALMAEAIANGTYQKDAQYGDYTKIRCSVWGPRAQKLSRVLAEGNTLAVTGTMKANEYNGNTYVNCTVRDLSVLKWVKTDGDGAATSTVQTPAPAPQTAPSNAGPAAASSDPMGSLMDGEDEDFELPF